MMFILRYSIATLLLFVFLSSFLLSAEEDVGYSTGVSLYSYDKYQRFSLTPRISFWKFNFAFDLELFFNLEKNKIDLQKTLDTSTPRNLADSLLRKISYFGFSNREDVVFGKEILHVGFGKIRNISLGTGILVNRFQNVYHYPEVKNIGFSFAFNSQKNLGAKLGMEFFTYNIKDIFSRSSGLLGGGRFFYNPLDFFQVGLGIALDGNQISGLRDQDDDGYPDVVDYFPENNSKFSKEDKIQDLKEKEFNDEDIEDFVKKRENSTFKFDNDKKDSIFLLSLDAIIELDDIVDMPLAVYTHGGVIIDDNDKIINPTNTKAEGFGYGFGIRYMVDSDLDFSIEYRGVRGYFRFGWFDESYELNRVQIDNGSLITKDNLIGSDNYNGINAIINSSLLNIATLEIRYEILIGEDNIQKLSGLIKMSEIFKDVPIVTYLEGFFHNDFISGSDDFVKNNVFLFYGYNLGLDFGGILMNYLYRVDWIRENSILIENPSIRISVGKRL